MPFFVIQVALPVPLRRNFDYLPLAGTTVAEYQPGQRVRVNFANQELCGLVLGVSQHSDVPANKLKSITALLDQRPILAAFELQLCHWLADYYHHSLGEVLEHFLPVLLRRGQSLDCVNEYNWQRTGAAEVPLRGSKQQALWALFKQQPLWSQRDLSQQGFNRTQLQSLEKHGLIRAYHDLPCPAVTASPEAPLNLNTEQAQAVTQLRAQLGRFAVSLLEGITGSGKTEVYLQLIAECLAQGKQALVLIPEIGLTPQTVKRFRVRFKVPIALLHSGLNDSERLQGWRQAHEGVARILIGTRSAVFTPMPDLGLIIIDEEHDGSFKQQDGLRYSARNFALVKAQKLGIPVLLGSATPSLESLHNALSGKYQHLTLQQRAGNAQLPKLVLQNTLHQPLISGFAEPVMKAMHEHLAQDKQVLVFINRRGFAPLLACKDCGWQAGCPHCDARLTLHQSPARLHCHHCDWQQPIPRFCPSCNGDQLLDLGQGTEKLEEQLRLFFPNQPIHRIDRDTVNSKQAFDRLYEQINQGGARVLIGTQMLAKGHHFPDVTLVVVLGTDSGLFSSDFRGLEHSAQLILQVAGRAGRAESPGTVMIQTLYAHHPALNLLLSGGYHALALQLLEERKNLLLPPFTHMALLRAEGLEQARSEQFLRHVRQFLQHQLTQLFPQQPQAPVMLLGPFPAIMEKKAGRYRYQIQFFSFNRAALHALLHELVYYLEAQKTDRKVRWHLDIDPIDTL